MPVAAESTPRPVAALVMIVVIGRDDPAVVKFHELGRAARQQDQASSEHPAVRQVHIAKVGARSQSCKPEESERIGLRRVRSGTASAHPNDRAIKDPRVERVDDAPDQFGGARGGGAQGGEDRYR